jgi:hypothetical protein
MAAAECNGNVAVFAGNGCQFSVSRNRIAFDQYRIAILRLESGHANRRHGREVMRLNGREQMLGEFGKLILNFQLNAGSQESHPFQQSFYIRIGIGRRLEPQPGSNRLMLFAKLPRSFTEIGEFIVVRTQQPRIHNPPPIPEPLPRRYQLQSRSGTLPGWLLPLKSHPRGSSK